jgi:hypothetical protein
MDPFRVPPGMLFIAPPPNQDPPWTDDDDNKLLELKGAGKDYSQIAQSLPGRTPLSCSNRISSLQKSGKIASAETSFWTEEKDNEVIRRTRRGESAVRIAKGARRTGRRGLFEEVKLSTRPGKAGRVHMVGGVR